ncbi:BA75_03233T0 [Komagataella pastoris]|uniref:BA75_03233T0 n=1 Tax=Komagataella pastoris TaxID=4922 RepID=A0A1B2JAE9_PICPA|nr:BA75_03233T0 [Komagataella pastoris]
MVGIINQVKLHRPDVAVKLPRKDGEGFSTLEDIINTFIPEFQDGKRSWFYPPLFNGHLQTMWAAAGSFEQVDQIYYGRRVLNYADGGSGTADFVISRKQFEEEEPGIPPKSQCVQTDTGELVEPVLPPRTRFMNEVELKNQVSDDTRPMLVVLHGLSGGSHEAYVRCLLKEVTEEHEFDAVVLNARGCAESQLSTPQLFNGFWTEDLRFLVDHLATWFPERTLFAVGASLGASILSNYIGQEGDGCRFAAAAVLGNPWDLAASSYLLHRSWIGRYIYSPAMTQSLMNLVDRHDDILRASDLYSQNRERYHEGIKLLYDFDNRYTAPLFKFNTAYEYYRVGSSVNRLPAVRTPLLIINALDDPIVGSEALPFQECRCNPFTLMLTTSLGGHLAWFQSPTKRWYVRPLALFFQKFYDTVDTKSQPEIDPKALPNRHQAADGRLRGPFQ